MIWHPVPVVFAVTSTPPPPTEHRLFVQSRSWNVKFSAGSCKQRANDAAHSLKTLQLLFHYTFKLQNLHSAIKKLQMEAEFLKKKTLKCG